MSTIIDPIIQLSQSSRKLTVVTVTFTSGLQYATGTATGLETVQQVIGAYLQGTGTTAANGISATFLNPAGLAPNAIGVSLAAANGAATLTAKVLVQGF